LPGAQVAINSRRSVEDGASAINIDVVEAQRFLRILDGDVEQFVFCAGDDDRQRAKLAKQAGKPTFAHKHGALQEVLPWLNSQQVKGWGAFVTVQQMRGARRTKEEV